MSVHIHTHVSVVLLHPEPTRMNTHPPTKAWSTLRPWNRKRAALLPTLTQRDFSTCSTPETKPQKLTGRPRSPLDSCACCHNFVLQSRRGENTSHKCKIDTKLVSVLSEIHHRSFTACGNRLSPISRPVIHLRILQNESKTKREHSSRFLGCQ